jgi:hypothetical protein
MAGPLSSPRTVVVARVAAVGGAWCGARVGRDGAVASLDLDKRGAAATLLGRGYCRGQCELGCSGCGGWVDASVSAAAVFGDKLGRR